MSGRCVKASTPSDGSGSIMRPAGALPEGGALLVRRVLSGTIHLLRNHLTVIRGVAQLSLMSDRNTAAQDLREIVRSCDVINDGFEDLISIGRVSAVPQTVDVCKEIKVAVSYAEGGATLSGARISMRLPDRATAVITDGRQLRLALSLLIGVTAEQTGWNGTVIVSVTGTEGCAVIRVIGTSGTAMEVSGELQTEHACVVAFAKHLVTLQGAALSKLCKCRGFKIILPTARGTAKPQEYPVL